MLSNVKSGRRARLHLIKVAIASQYCGTRTAGCFGAIHPAIPEHRFIQTTHCTNSSNHRKTFSYTHPFLRFFLSPLCAAFLAYMFLACFPFLFSSSFSVLSSVPRLPCIHHPKSQIQVPTANTSQHTLVNMKHLDPSHLISSHPLHPRTSHSAPCTYTQQIQVQVHSNRINLNAMHCTAAIISPFCSAWVLRLTLRLRLRLSGQWSTQPAQARASSSIRMSKERDESETRLLNDL